MGSDGGSGGGSVNVNMLSDVIQGCCSFILGPVEGRVRDGKRMRCVYTLDTCTHTYTLYLTASLA